MISQRSEQILSPVGVWKQLTISPTSGSPTLAQKKPPQSRALRRRQKEVTGKEELSQAIEEEVQTRLDKCIGKRVETGDLGCVLRTILRRLLQDCLGWI